jgi:hypothetical protein
MADVANYGDAAREVMARGRFLVKELGQDPRVLEHYGQWLAARGLPYVLVHMWATMTPSSMGRRADVRGPGRHPNDRDEL